MSLLGAQAPNFTLHDTTRETVSLEGLRGNKVVLAFFPAAFTGVCETELCAFRDAMAAFNGEMPFDKLVEYRAAGSGLYGHPEIDHDLRGSDFHYGSTNDGTFLQLLDFAVSQQFFH